MAAIKNEPVTTLGAGSLEEEELLAVLATSAQLGKGDSTDNAGGN